MNIVAWDIRGAGCPGFLSQVKKLVKKLEHNILFLSGTKINANRSLEILPKLQFDCFDFINLLGFSEGL